MAIIVYTLCALTSLTCAVMLGRGFAQSRSRLLFWSSAGFSFFALANILLCVDLLVFPSVNLILYRAIANLVGLLLMIFGLIWDTQK